MRLAALVLVAACGRIDFDPLATSTTASRRPLQISMGVSHACVIDADKHLWCWGSDVSGELGDGNSRALEKPVMVGTDTWHQVSANGITESQSFTCGVKLDSTLWCWGQNPVGQLGIGTQTPFESVPHEVAGGPWSKVAAGINCNACALDIYGALFCWGDDNDSSCGGYVGDGGLMPALSPVELPGGPWSDVSVGDAAACAIRGDGTLWCWGTNNRHELGDGTITTHPTPEQIGTSTSWTSIDMHEIRGCGLQDGGTMWCWGYNGDGLGGDGTQNAITVPEQIGTDRYWISVAPGMTETCAIDLGNFLWCWGETVTGALGTDDTMPFLVPTELDSVHGWHGVAAGQFATCGIRDNDVVCSGYDIDGVLGDGGSLHSTPAVIDSGWTAMSGGESHFCALDPTGTLSCWGDGTQLPTAVGNPGGSAPIYAGASVDCATIAGSIWCVGTVPGSPPTQTAVQLPGFTTIAFGDSHACGLHSDGTLWCFGDNSSGQLGTAGSGGATPVQVPGTWSSVMTGRYHTCAIASDGSLWCWGQNDSLQCGQLTLPFVSSPQQVGSATNWTKVFGGSAAESTCAQVATGELYCWGDDIYGELGDGGSTNSEQPHAVTAATDWSQVSVGPFTVCGLRSGTVWCWGGGALVGAGTTGRLVPTAVTAGGFTSVSVTSDATCALDGGGQRWCWGGNTDGALGDGKAWTTAFAPVAIP